jgi:hypothetical protein
MGGLELGQRRGLVPKAPVGCVRNPEKVYADKTEWSNDSARAACAQRERWTQTATSA